MKVYNVQLEGTTPILFGRQYAVPKESKESPAQYEERTWRERMHVDEKGGVVMPPLFLKNCLRETAKYLSVSIPGKGKSTYTKHFKSGIMVFESSPIQGANGRQILAQDVEGMWLNVPSDGMPGGAKRVPKCFPQINGWKAAFQVHVLDDTIGKDVLSRHLTEAGNFIGLGAMRVGSGGISGRFKVSSLTEAKV